MTQTDELRIEDLHRWARYPLQRPVSETLHVVTVAFFVVNEAVPGQNRLREPELHSCARQRAEPVVRKSTLLSASLRRTSTFHRIRESQRTHLVWDQEAPGAAPGYPTNYSSHLAPPR